MSFICYLDELANKYKQKEEAGRKRIIILHCGARDVGLAKCCYEQEISNHLIMTTTIIMNKARYHLPQTSKIRPKAPQNHL